MKYVLAIIGLLFCTGAQAQDALVVSSCGTLPLAYPAGATRLLTVDVNGKLCGSGGGGAGNPGGSDTQVQFNQAGSFGGISGATSDGTTLTLVAPVLGTPASGTLTNTTGFPIANLAGAGTGVLTALGNATNGAGGLVGFSGALGTPTSGTATNLTGLPLAGLTGLGTGVATALGDNVGSAGAFVTFNGALGTPSTGIASNLTGLPVGTGISGLGTGVATALAIAPGTTGSFPTQDGAITTGHCLQWGPGIQDSTAVCGGSGSSGANPTGTAGPTAVNGTATTFLRSDGAPAVQKGSNAQFGIVEGDGSTVTCVSGVCTAIPGVTDRVVTISTDTILSTDRGNIVYYNSASSIAVTQPAPSGSFANGFFVTLCNINTGIPTVTPGSGNIYNAGTVALLAGTAAAPYCIAYQSDGTNFNALQPKLGTAALASTGTSGAMLPFLNGTNTFSGTQTFGSVFGTVSTQSGTTYTLTPGDCGTEIAFTNAAAVTVTIPAALTTGCNIAILQTTSAGQVTVTGTAVSAATLESPHSYTKTFGQWSIIGINIYTTGTAVLTGDGA